MSYNNIEHNSLYTLHIDEYNITFLASYDLHDFFSFTFDTDDWKWFSEHEAKYLKMFQKKKTKINFLLHVTVNENSDIDTVNS